MIGVILPFVLRFLGEGVVGSFLEHRKDMAASANERDRIKYDRDVKLAEHELRRRQAQRDLQIAELERPAMYLPKALLMWCTSLYLSAIILASLFGLKTRYGLVIEDTPPAIWNVMMMVVGYWFLDKALKHFRK